MNTGKRTGKGVCRGGNRMCSAPQRMDQAQCHRGTESHWGSMVCDQAAQVDGTRLPSLVSPGSFILLPRE